MSSSTWLDGPADVVVVGGGSAGCIIAARLSEDPRLRVLLIEAGADVYEDGIPADILDTFPGSYFNNAYFWPGLSTEAVPGMPAVPVTQARVMGGGSSIMGMWALRGLPDDYNDWRDAGAVGWSWEDVLWAFKALERDLDCGGALHGKDGPIPIRRFPRGRWPGFVGALADAAVRNGLAERFDINAEFEDGMFPMPLSNDESGRVSAARGYLTPDVRSRQNLRILPMAQVLRLVIAEGRAKAVVASTPGGMRQIEAGNVILCAGALFSPTILMQSGVGPAATLSAAGVAPLLDLKGVGQRLQNHAVLNLATIIRRPARQSPDLRSYGMACARFSSGLPDAPRGDINVHLLASTSPFPHGTRIGVVGTGLYGPHSRGTIAIRSGDPAAAPAIDYAILADPFDRARMVKGLSLALKLLADPQVRATRSDVLGIAPTALIRRINKPSLRNRLLSPLLSAALDTPDFISRQLGRRLGSIIPEETLTAQETAEQLLPLVRPMSHPTGSCAMGAADDPAAVVDPTCKVRGLSNLFVADASIMPTIPRANTCIPVMMLAEHASRLIRRSLAP